jgi:hypothetical protein
VSGFPPTSGFVVNADGVAEDWTEWRRAEREAAADTEAAQTAFGPQIAAQAWSNEEPGTDPDIQTEHREWSVVWRYAAAMLATGIILAIAAATIAIVTRGDSAGTPPPTTTTVTAAPPPPPVALPPTLRAPPPAPSVASASPYASLVGKWRGHHRGLTVSPDGTIELQIPDNPACPACPAFQMPFATIHIGLTGYDGNADGTPDGSGKFFGYVKDSSDPRVIPVGVPVEVDVITARDFSYPGLRADPTLPGRVMTISVNGDGASNELGIELPFCDDAADQRVVCGP